jgi:hypothetical protein
MRFALSKKIFKTILIPTNNQVGLNALKPFFGLSNQKKENFHLI